MQHTADMDALVFLRKPQLSDVFILLSLASQNYSWPGVAKILGLPVLSEAKISDTPGPSGPRKGRPALSPCPVNGHWEATACLGGYQQQVQNMLKT